MALWNTAYPVNTGGAGLLLHAYRIAYGNELNQNTGTAYSYKEYAAGW